ncbi:MAG: Phosphoribosyltransferase [Candidatus Woesebacteria bacterium GW2011_GWB1_38_5b]|uniref:Phosphoribosyltransferase n=1 Tax=Candidatus Woesebacteria bacterium GW2011_GWB1_38_5b TaxID=1618569 RepID=A0A0G0K3Y0_9BACT|nr:MAG: Phosphoribosyltransferase [Candidatus Woesebacteria bacterium GW2011_GWB1_38_5b]
MGKEHYFENRSDAGQQLAKTESLMAYKDTQALVLALPRGGVEVGWEIAKELGLPLTVIIARKVGAPWNEEFGVAAVSEEDVVVLNQKISNTFIKKQQDEVTRRVQLYRGGLPLPDLTSSIAILVDDGIATGLTVRAAIGSLRKLKAQKVVLATPVCSGLVEGDLKAMVDEFVCLIIAWDMNAVGEYYKHFDQLTDKQVLEYLKS